MVADTETQPPPTWLQGREQRLLQWLCCEVGGLTLALPVTGLREILRAPPMAPLPLSPAWVRGAINLRGSALPVIDLALRLGLTGSRPGRRASVLVFNPQSSEDAALGGAQALGLWVDRVFEITAVDPGQVDAVPLFGNPLPSRFISQVLRWRNQPVLGLDMGEVLASGELSAAIESHAEQVCAQRLTGGQRAATER
jgi:purine-binding chemotaxis protein CheW